MVPSNSANRYLNNTMTLTGQGAVTATPDLAVIRLGVQTTGYNLSRIQSDNAQINQNIIQALNQAGYTDIRTAQYTIDKAYDYQDGNQVDKGYTVRNILEIRTNKVSQVGAIIDTAVEMGANIVESISFELSNPQLYYQRALNLAINDAIQKAKSIAENLHIKLFSVPTHIVENSASPAPVQEFQRQVATTILPGELNVEAFITADFLYS